MKFVLASHNKGKLKEMAAILGELGIEVASLPEGAPEPEENGATFEENARIKAKAAADFTGLPAIADDSGLCVDALGGAPGIRSARYCEGTDAVLADGETVTVRGECEGELLHENHGVGGFGYDPLFYVPEYECTFGELAPEVKNRISHRARALGRLRDVLKDKI